MHLTEPDAVDVIRYFLTVAPLANIFCCCFWHTKPYVLHFLQFPSVDHTKRVIDRQLDSLDNDKLADEYFARALRTFPNRAAAVLVQRTVRDAGRLLEEQADQNQATNHTGGVHHAETQQATDVLLLFR